MQVLQVSEVAVKVLLGSKLKKKTDEFDAHSRFMDDRIPGLVTLTIRVWIKKGFVQLNSTETVPAGSAAMEPNCFPICLAVGAPRASSQVGTNALRGFSLNEALGSPR